MLTIFRRLQFNVEEVSSEHGIFASIFQQEYGSSGNVEETALLPNTPFLGVVVGLCITAFI